MEDRVSDLERRLANMENAHKAFQQELSANTLLTKQVVANTSDLVDIFKAAKTTNNVFMWIAGVILKVGGVSSMLLIVWHALKTGDISHLWKLGGE